MVVSKYTAINRKWWNAITPVHASSSHYALKNFKKGKTNLQRTEILELGNVKDKTMLHLLCHFGLDTLSWARRGAIVTGVDISDASIIQAKKLSKELSIPATFIRSDIYDLPKVHSKKYDIVFASYGVLLWLSNLKKFAKIVHSYLKEGGYFYIIELHPFTNMLSYDFQFYYKYFDKGPYVDDDGTYVDWKKKVTGETYLWNHTMGEFTNALIDAGLKIEYIHEFPYTMYEQFEGLMSINKKGQYVLKDKKIQIPLLFSLKASRSKA